jgi:hypothetical protein
MLRSLPHYLLEFCTRWLTRSTGGTIDWLISTIAQFLCLQAARFASDLISQAKILGRTRWHLLANKIDNRHARLSWPTGAEPVPTGSALHVKGDGVGIAVRDEFPDRESPLNLQGT